MTKRYYEQTATVPVYVREARQRPNMTRDVLTPTAWTAILAGLIVAGLGVVIMWLEGTTEAAPILCGGTITVAGIAGTAMLVYQLVDYNAKGWTEREDMPIEVEPEDAVYEPVRGNTGRQLRSFTLTEPELVRYARLLWLHGEWQGGDYMTRKPFEPWLVNYSQKYPKIVTEFIEWGWIVDKDNRIWTDYGRERLFYRATHPTKDGDDV